MGAEERSSCSKNPSTGESNKNAFQQSLEPPLSSHPTSQHPPSAQPPTLKTAPSRIRPPASPFQNTHRDPQCNTRRSPGGTDASVPSWVDAVIDDRGQGHPEGRYHCRACDVSFGNILSGEIHCNSQQHKNMLKSGSCPSRASSHVPVSPVAASSGEIPSNRQQQKNISSFPSKSSRTPGTHSCPPSREIFNDRKQQKGIPNSSGYLRASLSSSSSSSHQAVVSDMKSSPSSGRHRGYTPRCSSSQAGSQDNNNFRQSGDHRNPQTDTKIQHNGNLGAYNRNRGYQQRIQLSPSFKCGLRQTRPSYR